jgi:hypothetical protein
MLRRLFTVLSALSLLLCAAAVVLWVRSYTAPPTPYGGKLPAGGHRLLNCRGQVVWLHHRRNVTPPWVWVMTTVYVGGSEDERVAVVQVLIRDPATPWDPANRVAGTILSRPFIVLPIARGVRLWSAGFEVQTARLDLPKGDYSGPPEQWTWEQSAPVAWAVGVPHWAVTLLLLVLPARAGWKAKALRRGRRLARGECAACGYDLRATPGRCPECGTPAAGKGA